MWRLYGCLSSIDFPPKDVSYEVMFSVVVHIIWVVTLGTAYYESLNLGFACIC